MSEADVSADSDFSYRAQVLALHHTLISQAPLEPPVYRYLEKLPVWLERTRAACRQPSSRSERAAGWILDNDYHVRRAIRQTAMDLPAGFLKHLPSLGDLTTDTVAQTGTQDALPDEPSLLFASREWQGHARALHLVLVGLHEMRLQPDLAGLVQFVEAYQRIEPLSEAELWAIPPLARLVCLDLLVAAVADLDDLVDAPFAPFAEYTRAGFMGAEQGTELGNRDDGQTPDQFNATDRISSAITSMVALNEIDWFEFVNQTSLVNAKLANDPVGVYTRMDNATRNRYRSAVEQIARRCAPTELQVASQVVSLADANRDDDRLGHVGYWLIDEGRAQLESTLDANPAFRRRWLALIRRHTGKLYAMSIIALMLIGLAVPAAYLDQGGASLAMQLVVAVLSVMPASVIAIAVVHWFVTHNCSPTLLPTLDARLGIPEGAETVIAVPVIIASLQEVEQIMERLELRHLANPESGLCYALLSDPADADTETVVSDEAIEAALVAGIQALNARHQDAGCDRFLLLHRRREFNASEGCWMAWERKRGKIEQFNYLLTEGWRESFSLLEGDIEQLMNVRYVISLDADTILPPGAAVKLVCTLTHPLNRARVDEVTDRVTSGYTILQPRIETLSQGGSSSTFVHLFAGDSAIDIYSRAVSDVYQDLFGVGSYVGKGIYDVKSFARGLTQRVPEQSILSHDLFEGLHGRVALCTNIVLYESYPDNWPEYAARQHRWIRGDWQLLPWLGFNVPVAPDQRARSRFSALDRWKLIDNLRRSLIPVAMLLYFLGAWFVFPGSAVVWTTLAIGAFSPYLLDEAFAGIAQLSYRQRSRGFAHRVRVHSGRSIVSIAFLVVDSIQILDAIFRTLWRIYVSRKYLLRWRASSHWQSASSSSARSAQVWRLMWYSPVVAMSVFTALFQLQSNALAPAIPVLLCWFLAPWLAIRLGQSRSFRRDSLDSDDSDFLNQVARRTWHYFDDLCRPEDHWLPPDNFQSDPGPLLARRTSPTNIGLYLSSMLAARDLGFIGARELSVRARNTLDALDRLTKHRGHFLNWYSTKDLTPLEPQYVSTVDSGNLAVCLIALKQGCGEFPDTALLGPQDRRGLEAALSLLSGSIVELDPSLCLTLKPMLVRVEQALVRLSEPDAWLALRKLDQMDWPELESRLNLVLADVEVSKATLLAEVNVWQERFAHQLHALVRDSNELAPWLVILESPPVACQVVADEIALILSPVETLRVQARNSVSCREKIDIARQGVAADTVEGHWLERMDSAILEGIDHQRVLLDSLDVVANRASVLAYDMQFDWLYDQSSRLFRIGYNVSTGTLDPNHYDLLASEARMASYFAIAKQDVPVEHWFQLGRPVIRHDGQPAVQSWSGSMFEYLMPPLFLPGKRDTLLGESESVAVLSQQAHARAHSIPWGVSESAFGMTDAEGTYQYRAFGTPALGIRRGLSEDQVVAPYASMLALGVWPDMAVSNLKRLASLGTLHRYGFIDALDYSSDRKSASSEFRAVNTWMAHHQGMSLVAITNALEHDCMPARVLREKSMQAIELLLQERVPWEAHTEKGRVDESVDEGTVRLLPSLPGPWIPVGPQNLPQLQLLGNGRLSARVTHRGGGALFYRGHSLTRWNADATASAQGYRFHVANADSGESCWLGDSGSSALRAGCSVRFSAERVEFTHRLQDLGLRLEVAIGAHSDVDARRITVTNEAHHSVQIKVTSIAEVVLARPADDERHPAFSKLFVHSRHEPTLDGLSFERRPRSPAEQPPVLLHRIVSAQPGVAVSGIETDRGCWLGRLGNFDEPAALSTGLTNTTGWTLDTVMSLQAELSIPPGETRQLVFLSVVGDSRQRVLDLAGDFGLPAVDRLFADAATDVAQEVRRLGLSPENLRDLQSLASLLLYPHPHLREWSELPSHALPAQQELWASGVSGDLPVLVLRMNDESPIDLLDMLVRAHVVWRQRGLMIDLVVLRTGPSSYEEPLRLRIMDALRDAGVYDWLGRDGGVHLLSASSMGPTRLQALLSCTSLRLDAEQGLADRLDEVLSTPPALPLLAPVGAMPWLPVAAVVRPEGLLFDNGLGGFDSVSGEYVLHLEAGERTPSPWCNIMANEQFGSVVSESGLGFSWGLNSGEHRITRWSNDPVADTPGEMIFLRDESTGEVWTVTPTARYHDTAIQVVHGFGHTRWLRNSHGLEQQLQVLVDAEQPVKLSRLTLHNRSGQARRLTVTYFADWQLGAVVSQSVGHVHAEYDATTQAIVASNRWNPEFAERCAFLSASMQPHSITGDRRELIGPEGDVTQPDGLALSDLGGAFTAGADACAAYQVHLDIAVGGSANVCFILGEVEHRDGLEQQVEHWRSTSAFDDAMTKLQTLWEKRTCAVQVRTPDAGFDLLINHWLIYQSISSRLLARAGFYQAGGAYGFRDQLQDVLALLPSEPEWARRQILIAAEHQFEEGDVLHWWHPPGGRGVRTQISDDRLWLPWVTARYLEATGDSGILDASIAFLDAPVLGDHEHDRYAGFDEGQHASLYEHCCRALECGMVTGVHGLPLIGTGDWNDGLDRVGHEGRGESIWLAWFRISVVNALSPIAEERGDIDRAQRFRAHADRLHVALETAGWDGRWYVRAFDDEGEPWGSMANEECRIDAIAQAWSVLTGGGDEQRAISALHSADEHLIDRKHRLVRLLTPPFHETSRNPGYIKAYPPGIRENGGQYTHAAAWLGLAFAKSGDGNRAHEIFDIINPIGRTSDRTSVERYAREPYVLAADVCGAGPNVGRGGWSWYTGAASWTWQLGVQAILGIHHLPGAVRLEPCLPDAWDHVDVMLKAGRGTLALSIKNPEHVSKGIVEVLVDDVPQQGNVVRFPDDDVIRRVVVQLGHAARSTA